jgi:hypothetical protein
MPQPNKGKFQKMKTVFNKVAEECEEFSSNEKFPFEDEEEHIVEKSTKNKQLSDKVYRFRNTIDTVEVQSYKDFDIDIEDDPEKIKCSSCVNHCVIY